MNYEIESKLREKADNWKVFNLEQKVDSLSRELSDLKSEKERLKVKIDNQSQAIFDIIQILVEKDTTGEYTSQLVNLRGFL